MALRPEDLPGIGSRARDVLLAYSRLSPPRPPLASFCRDRAPYSTISKASQASDFPAKLAAHDAETAAVRDVAAAADTSFAARIRAVLEGHASDPDAVADPSKVRSMILAMRALDEMEAATPQASEALSLDPILKAATRALVSPGLADPSIAADFTRLHPAELECLIWLVRRAQGVDEPYRQPETMHPGDPGQERP